MRKKLGKTELEILEKLELRESYSVEAGIARGSWDGKFRPFGRREFAAAEKLVARGLVKIVHRSHSSHTGCNGQRMTGTILVIEKV